MISLEGLSPSSTLKLNKDVYPVSRWMPLGEKSSFQAAAVVFFANSSL
jgi:hypothetical protein